MTWFKKKYYHYSVSQMQFQEIKWFRLKLAGALVVFGLIGVVAFRIVISYSDIVGFGYGRVSALRQENAVLREQLASLTNRTKGLEATLDELNREGNQFRLMVDLPKMNEDVSRAGTGGSTVTPDFLLGSEDLNQMLQLASSAIERLNSEAKVQKQSYEEIQKKYGYNKEFFASLPALKPMEGYYSTNGFGLRMHPVLGIFKHHEGLDILNEVGTPVVATGDGVVEISGHAGSGYGIVIVINHGFGYQTLYAHLSKVLVREGQHVKRGQRIAKSGRTGLVSGPHLHYEIRLNGVCQNPVDYFFDDVSARFFKKSMASR